MATRTSPPPFVWTVLYLPFGALGGFVTVALTFLATRSGLSITEGALLNGAQMLTAWLKWLWAPVVDVTWTPRAWYVFATVCSALGVAAMAAIPLSPGTLNLLLAIIAVASIINSMVGMSIEAIMSEVVQPDEHGKVSAWFQAGNLGGAGVGGGLGLFMLQWLPEPWMAGAVLGLAFVSCCAGLLWVPPLEPRRTGIGAFTAVRSVVSDLGSMVKTQGGLLAAILCALPVGTGAAQGVLTQAEVALYWGAGDTEVALVQGVLNGIVTAFGCFVGGWLCDRFHPRNAYAGIGLALAAIAVGMALSPATVTMYVVWSLVYALGVGLAYAAFTAVALNAMGIGSGATKYNIFASLSNFPIWWLGLLLGWVAEVHGSAALLLAEAALGVAGVGVFAAAVFLVGKTTLPKELPRHA